MNIGNFVAARRAASPARTLAVYDKRANRASVASTSDICLTSANLLKRTERIDESSLSVPEHRSRSGVLTGTNVGSL